MGSCVSQKFLWEKPLFRNFQKNFFSKKSYFPIDKVGNQVYNVKVIVTAYLPKGTSWFDCDP